MEHKQDKPSEIQLDSSGIRALIESRPGELFSLDFIKANGELRRMNCQYGVNAKREGNLGYDPMKGGNIVVFDCSAGQCRTIKLDSVLLVSYGDGVKYQGPMSGQTV